MSGKLTWEVTYYDKAPLNPTLKKEEGIDHSLPVELQQRPELKVSNLSQLIVNHAHVESGREDNRCMK